MVSAPIIMSLPVAPFTGAWIEMLLSDLWVLSVRSLPSRERGLKFSFEDKLVSPVRSLPSRERGLK